MTYIGIDNGVSGAICHIDEDGRLIQWFAMPIRETKDGNEVDAYAIHKYLWRLKTFFNLTVVIEKPAGSRFPKMATSMSGSFHAVRAVVDVLGLKCLRITPQSWQKQLLNCKAGKTKPAALHLARQLWPTQTWLATERSKKPHDGAVDAALIAEYGRRNKL